MDASDRADQEEDQADLQRALAPEAVAEGAGGEEHPGEHQGVGVDHPLEVGGGGVEVGGQGGHGHVEGGVADDDDHQARAEHGEDRLPAGVDRVIDRLGDGHCPRRAPGRAGGISLPDRSGTSSDSQERSL